MTDANLELSAHTNPWWTVATTAIDPAMHCFRSDNCALHDQHDGPNCCCCGLPAEAHTGCDCQVRP